MGGMTLVGEYVPSKAQWVRDQVEKFEASDGQEANTLRDGGDPIVVITSVGAKSGNLRKNPVMRVERDGIYVAIASKGGADDQPEWYYNFVAHPEVELQDGAVKKTYRVDLVEGDGAGRPVAAGGRHLATYASYQKKTDRADPGLQAHPHRLTCAFGPSPHGETVPELCPFRRLCPSSTGISTPWSRSRCARRPPTGGPSGVRCDPC